MAAKELDNKEQYSELIKFLVPINELSPQLQNEVINIGKVLKFKKKDFVFKQGDRDSYSYYLLDGQIELLSNKQVTSTIASGADSARYAMARLQPRQFSAKAVGEVVVLQLDRAALDRLMVAEQQQSPADMSSTGIEVEVSDIGEEDSGDWMTKMLQSELFCRLPTANIHQLFALLEPINFNAGDTVITQGETGENFYIIQEGRCDVTRAPSSDAKPIKLAELRAGDSFGEEALLTEAKRNASITMKTDGVLMQLSKENFINLIKKPTLEEVSYKEGEKLVKEGATWLDVRFPNEFDESCIEGSVNIPLNMLRMQTDKLDKNNKYIIYCDTGGRSSAAAFLLTDRGFDVCFLSNGLSSVPEASLVNKLPTEAPKTEETPAAKQEPPKQKEEPVEDSELDSDIRASVLDVNLERTNLDLQEAIKQATEEDENKAKEARAAQEKLLKEKKKLEAEKKAAEEAAAKLRQQEAAKLEKLKKEAEKRLSDEKKKIEEIYTRNTREMEKLQKLKEQAEAQIRKEREKLEKEAEESKQKNKEVEELKKQLEESRAALEKQAEKQRQEQNEMEQAIQAKAKAKLEAEKRKLAEEFARTNEEMEKAQRAQAMADAARKAAQDEAKKIINEYKKQFDEERSKEQARLEEERKKLESESRKLQETLKEIQKSKQEAETVKQVAEKEAKKLREQQLENTNSGKKAQKEMEDQIKAAEARMKEAQKNLESAQQAEVSIEAAKEVNEQELIRQKVEAEKLKQQVADDLADFDEEQKQEQEGMDKVVAHADHIKRIKERAAAAKREAQKATDNLFADVAAQLGKED